MTMKKISFALLASLSLLALSTGAQDKPRSLNDARQGNTSGILIWEQKKAPAAPAAPGTGASAPAAAGTSASPSMNAAKAEPPGSSALGRMFSTIREQNPPSGKPLGSAKKLDAPSQGIPIPTAPPASAPR
jgi:hypothetical protein